MRSRTTEYGGQREKSWLMQDQPFRRPRPEHRTAESGPALYPVSIHERRSKAGAQTANISPERIGRGRGRVGLSIDLMKLALPEQLLPTPAPRHRIEASGWGSFRGFSHLSLSLLCRGTTFRKSGLAIFDAGREVFFRHDLHRLRPCPIRRSVYMVAYTNH